MQPQMPDQVSASTIFYAPSNNALVISDDSSFALHRQTIIHILLVGSVMLEPVDLHCQSDINYLYVFSICRTRPEPVYVPGGSRELVCHLL